MESENEMLSRVRLMAAGDHTWDLSDNDCTALKYVLGQAACYRECSAERDRLRAEVSAAQNRALIAEAGDARARKLLELRDESIVHLNTALNLMTAERDAAKDENAGLREALEKIDRSVTRLNECATPELRELGLNLRLVCRTALARTSSQHRDRIVAAGLREAAKEAESTTPKCDIRNDDRPRYREIGRREVIAEMRTKADRLERGE